MSKSSIESKQGTDSSSGSQQGAESAEGQTPDAGTDKPKVPLAAITASREKARAAQGEVERLQRELEEAKAQLQQDAATKVDPASLSPLVAQMLVEARQAAEAEMAPLRAELAQLGKFKMAAKLGLNEAQVDKVTALKQKHHGLDDAQALLLARAAHPDVFPSQAQRYNPALHGALPVGGVSEARGDGMPVDHTRAMHEAAKQDKLYEAQQHAEAAFNERLRQVFPQMRPRS